MKPKLNIDELIAYIYYLADLQDDKQYVENVKTISREYKINTLVPEHENTDFTLVELFKFLSKNYEALGLEFPLYDIENE